MAVNSFMKNRQIWGKTVILVPYRELHVVKYNNWMQSEDLRYLTASEPLSLQEEFAMLNKWTNDANKCTFIIVDKVIFEATNSETEAMIGDVNLFFDDQTAAKVAEIEVMIAEKAHQSKGKGKEASLMMMRFGVEVIKVEEFIAKIKYNNRNSQQMFSNFGFKEIARSDVFEEITYSLLVNDEWFDSVKQKMTDFDYRLL